MLIFLKKFKCWIQAVSFFAVMSILIVCGSFHITLVLFVYLTRIGFKLVVMSQILLKGTLFNLVFWLAQRHFQQLNVKTAFWC